MRHFEVFTGRVGQIRDLVELAEGNCVVNFSVAETPRIKKEDGTWGDGTTVWTDVSVFGDEARNFVRSAKPGTFVTVSGSRSAREYTVKDTSEKRVVQQVTAEQLAISLTKFHFVEEIGNVNYSKDGRGGSAPKSSGNKTSNAKQKPNNTKVDEDPFAGNSDDSDPFGGANDDPFNLQG